MMFMKKLSFIVIAVALLTQGCYKGTVDTKPEGAPSAGAQSLTYEQINGKYILFDSIYFIGNQALQPLLPEYRHPITRIVTFNIDRSTAPVNLVFDNQIYYENYGVANQYMTDDKYFDIQKVLFTKDSVFINYFRRQYRNDSSLNISVKGYKIK